MNLWIIEQFNKYAKKWIPLVNLYVFDTRKQAREALRPLIEGEKFYRPKHRIKYHIKKYVREK